MLRTKTPKPSPLNNSTQVGAHVIGATEGAPATKQVCAHQDSEGLSSALAHPSKPLLIYLNKEWRVDGRPATVASRETQRQAP